MKKGIGFLFGFIFLTLLGCAPVIDWFKGATGISLSSDAEIIVMSRENAVADGKSDLKLSVKLQSSKGEAVANTSFILEPAPDSGVTFATCEKSNAQGIAICSIRATTPGLKSLRVKDRKEVFQVQFDQ